ncbi:FecR family protein [Dyadobacter luticola]|uniref:DUF4974 domain-containing protein n=1 Tax=Dyadobacter luticola TaxID=1979387 RepID=A0A5R9KTU1_9BACT|nr:FecR domain-containing protein [Dyadobacter luticola]TLU99486.1 DUF4974 domain-containing protein [Dyadobacter luticola]
MKPKPISPVLLEKYLSGQCTDQEKELVENWYASIEGETDYLDTLPEDEQTSIQNETFGQIRGALNFEPEKTGRTIPWRMLVGIAASLLLIVGIYFSYSNNSTPPTIAEKLKAMDESSLASFENKESRIIIFQLPDSSSVALRPGAVITYPKAFEADQRLVTFSGEGFFNVKKDKTRPFFIQSGEMVIRVLGTSFNVKAPVAEKLFQVDVVTGRVQVTAPNKERKSQQVVLKPQEQALFELDSRKLISKTNAPQMRKAIYEPVTIVFEETPLDQVTKQLEKKFNVKINLSEPRMSTCSVTANFESQPLASILEMLCTTLDASYILNDNTITVNGLPCE